MNDDVIPRGLTVKNYRVPGHRHARYQVLDQDGEVLSTGSTHLYRALEIAEAALRRKKRKDRPCICCTRIFRSEGPHNRMCRHCRLNDGAHRDGMRWR